MQNHPTYQEYKSLRLPAEDYTGTRTRRNFLRSLGPAEIVSLNNSVVNTILRQGNISEDQVHILREIDHVLRDESIGGVVREDGEAYIIEHAYGITIHGNYLGPRKYNGYTTVVKLKVGELIEQMNDE